MNRRKALLVLSALTTSVVGTQAVLGQSLKPIPRVTILFFGRSSSSNSGGREEFRRGMLDNGYVDGKNVLFEEIYIGERSNKLPEIISDILVRKPAVIVLTGSQTVRAAKLATSTVPIVANGMSDPVEQGFAISLAHPGGNITGFTTLAEELVNKRLEVLLEIVPKAKRIGYLANPANPTNSKRITQVEAAAKRLGLTVFVFNATSETEFDQALKLITKERVDALLVGVDALHLLFRQKIIDALAKNRMPAIHGFTASALDGGLMSYSPNQKGSYLKVARLVHQILNGANPGDLPIEQPTQVDLFLNLGTAKQLGIKFPQSILVRADRVI